jgi:LysR family transcriptional regulator, nitrogen assimilation regulatory protein
MYRDGIVMYRALLSQSGFSMDRLATLCELADLGSFSKAAKGDPNTASLMSRQIRELESFFGTDLVRRKGRGLELTEAGVELAAVGRENFKGIADFAARCRGRDWCVRLAASNSVAQWVVLPKMGEILRRCPGVRFEIHHQQTREMVAMTREGVFDLALVRKDALLPGMRRAVLGEIRHALFIPQGLSRQAPKSVATALVSLPMALPIGGHMRELMDQLAASAGGTPKIAVACSSYMQAAGLVAGGACAAVLPETAINTLEAGKIHRLPLPHKIMLCLVWTARNADTRPSMVGLISALEDILRLPQA